MSSLKLYNVNAGSTMLLQYIGDPFDTVTFSALAVLPTATFLQDIPLSVYRNVVGALVADLALAALITEVPTAQPTIQVANKNGVANLVLWAQGFPANYFIRATADVQPQGV